MILGNLALGLALAVTSAPPPVPPLPAKGYRLVFADDFGHLDLSPDGHGEHTWSEGVWFSAHHAPLANIVPGPEGVTLRWTRGQEQPDTSLATFSRKGQSSHAWRYGYFEVRMKWKPEPGAWPAVWLLPSTLSESEEMGELDIFEGNSEHPHSFFGTIHDWRRDPADPNKMIHVQNSGTSDGFALPPDTDFTAFHTYGMLWEPDKITWYFDGNALHSETGYPIFNAQTYSLIIGMQAGVNWQLGNLDGIKADTMAMTVDWVHVWQK